MSQKSTIRPTKVRQVKKPVPDSFQGQKSILSTAYRLLLTLLLLPYQALALTPKEQACLGATGSTNCGGIAGPTLEQGFKTVANILIFLVGAIAVLMIIIGGLRYVLSGGDPGGTKSAKDTILYAIIGVVVAILAYAVVNFVLTRF
ncbi:MAG TPA: pilin [Candidatus Saccharimonadales bacterium]|nr:pilin [Candidatus Saccharimonadales bacterium]